MEQRNPLGLLISFAYFAYLLFALSMFAATIYWYFDIDNLFLRILTFAAAFIAVAACPLLGLVVMCVMAYYMAEILDWGWFIGIALAFPGLALTLITYLGAFGMTLGSSLLKRK